MGDKGGDDISTSTKFGLMPATNDKSNSPHNFTLLAIWNGDDNKQMLNTHLPAVMKQINEIVTIEIGQEILRIQWLV
jgi:hypothetical protein